MRVNDYLEQLNDNDKLTFIIVMPRKDEHSPFYHNEYKTTPVRCVWEWKEGNSTIMNHIVVNKNHPPIDITGCWVNWYNCGSLKCCVIESEESLRLMYSEKQANDMIEYYERTIK